MTKKVFIDSITYVISTFFVSLIWLVLTGLMAHHFTAYQFGLWSLVITINSLCLSLDLGFANALRNKIASLFANDRNNDKEELAYFFSTFYVFLSIVVVLSLLTLFSKNFIPWNILFNTSDQAIILEGSKLFIIAIIFSLFNVVFSLNMAGFFGYQESFWNSLFAFLSKLSILVLTVCFISIRISFFWTTVLLFAGILFSSIFAFNFFLHKRKWKILYIEYKELIYKLKELWSKSIYFAFLQLFAVIYLWLDMFIVTKNFGLEVVGDYSLVKRGYLVFSTLYLAFLAPIWSAYTVAIEKNDIAWAKKVLNKSCLIVFFIFIPLIFFICIFGAKIIYFWTGKHINNLSLYLLLGIWSLVYSWNNCFSIFLNATGNLKLQIFLIGLAIVLFIPLSNYFGKYYGVAGICTALILVSLPIAVSNPIQSYLFLNKKSLLKS